MDLDKTVQQIKKDFYAYRNGIVADTLRKHGDSHRYIMGCQLTDVMAVAANYESSLALASKLWDDVDHRECRMIAPMLCPPNEFNSETAVVWCRSVENNEIADVLCHRLLRKLPYAVDLYKQLANSESDQVRYVAFRLLLNLILLGKVEPSAQIKAIVEAEQPTASPALAAVLNSIVEECEAN